VAEPLDLSAVASGLIPLAPARGRQFVDDAGLRAGVAASGLGRVGGDDGDRLATGWRAGEGRWGGDGALRELGFLRNRVIM
jgi:hypothetical protein